MQKSGNVKLRITNKNQWGKTVILPTVGETEIGKDGIFEVEDTVATILLNQTNDYSLVEGNGTTVTAEIHADKIDEESSDYLAPDEEDEDEDSDEDSSEDDADDSEDEDNDDSEDSDEDTDEDDSDEDNSEEGAEDGEGDSEDSEEDEDDGLDDKKLSELLDIAKEAEIPEEDYKKFKKSKKLMVNFLRKYAAE